MRQGHHVDPYIRSETELDRMAKLDQGAEARFASSKNILTKNVISESESAIIDSNPFYNNKKITVYKTPSYRLIICMQQSANSFCSSGARHLYSALFTPPLPPPCCLEILLFFAMWEHPGIVLDIYICASPFCNRYQAV